MRDLYEEPDRSGQAPVRLTLERNEDRRWLAVLAGSVGIEFCWWLVCWTSGIAPAPHLFTHLILAISALGIAWALSLAIDPAKPRWIRLESWVGTALVGVGSSLFLSLKYAIPNEIWFWLDPPLAAAERTLFGRDPWQWLDPLLGWAVMPIDRIYGLWLPTQLLVLFTLMLRPASPAKSRALIAYSLAWLLLGVFGAVLLSSVGPIFYDRLYGGQQFAGLAAMLHERGAWMALAESDAMWASFASKDPGTVAGISAMPSLHVAITFWFFLAARNLAPRAAPFALGYTLLIWVGSVQLGWHYVADGLVGIVGMISVWLIAGAIDGTLASSR